MDNIISAQRAAKEKAHKDSVTIANELKNHKTGHADILDLPAGISKEALTLILDRGSIKYKSVQKHIQIDSVVIEGRKVTAAFYFDANDRYNGYEMETDAVKAAAADATARAWANGFAASYEKKLGKPNAVNRVGFRDIKQGRLSITSKWDKHSPYVFVGLATDNHLYYAKVMVNY
jgi:hypothetical protein